MKIKRLEVNDRQFIFSDKTLLYSNKNGVGKTSLIRLLLYGMGYPIPSTKGLNFDNLKVRLTLSDEKNKEMVFIRKKNRNKDILLINNKEQLNLKDQDDFLTVLGILYDGVTEPLILNNILGLHYFDQEKGWTLLNRGKIIGNIHFSVEPLIEGLTSINVSERLQKIAELKEENKTYRQLKKILEWRDKFDTKNGNIDWEKFDTLQTELKSINFEINRIQKTINRLTQIKRKNFELRNFIEHFKLRVMTDSGDVVLVTKDNIIDFDDNQKIINTKIAIASRELRELKLKGDKKNSLLNNQLKLVNDRERISHFIEAVTNLKYSTDEVKNIINYTSNQLRKENSKLDESLDHLNIMNVLYEEISKYTDLLGVKKYIDHNNKFILTRELKGYSGSQLHLIVFGFRLAFLKVIQNLYSITVPIILDSPRSGELSSENFDKMLELLKIYFPHNQLIIATIFMPRKKFENEIILKDTLLTSGEKINIKNEF